MGGLAGWGGVGRGGWGQAEAAPPLRVKGGGLVTTSRGFLVVLNACLVCPILFFFPRLDTFKACLVSPSWFLSMSGFPPVFTFSKHVWFSLVLFPTRQVGVVRFQEQTPRPPPPCIPRPPDPKLSGWSPVVPGYPAPPGHPYRGRQTPSCPGGPRWSLGVPPPPATHSTE